jgi:hypothetical protein
MIRIQVEMNGVKDDLQVEENDSLSIMEEVRKSISGRIRSNDFSVTIDDTKNTGDCRVGTYVIAKYTYSLAE